MNSYDLKADYGPSAFDQRQRAVISFIYQLPFGRGRQFGSSWNGVMDAVLGGWIMTGILTTETGTPFTPMLSNSVDQSKTGQFADRPNQIGNPKATPCVAGTFFNTCAYAPATPGTFGDARRDSIEGPHYTNVDWGFRKDFKLRERYDFDFRAEMFNLLNHPTFQGPDNTFEDSTFGFISTANAQRDIQIALRFSF